MNRNFILLGILFAAIILIGIGVFMLVSNKTPTVKTTPIRSETVQPVRNQKLEVFKSSLKINSDESWTALVSANEEEGVKLETIDGRKFEVKAGDIVIIEASGLSDIGRGPMSPNGETTGYRDTAVDSPYKDRVGGLEMWIGNKSNRYFVGTNFNSAINDSGVPTFRVIESYSGFRDGNWGGFTVTIRKK